ncbi:sulfonate ABC transporter substrate-binding protein [Clostridium polyendosporum]|uniref:Sulfonate ABC transporter substrate-binding protein n=1 Tax=Clostridium polyendosporum TaxID=69208 RepID=A0A919S1K9_9CLOT|nr:ABC transporter substrate-binding protein [Clostridium polyendosporum]GIM29764.1 sulfonate ABC transporter substrate-binding protein [Clostridium polyendosporum]
MKNKRLLMTLVTMSLTVLLTGCGVKKENKANIDTKTSTNKEQTLIPVRFGADSGTFSIQFQVAKEKGYFEKYGIKPEISVYSYGIDTLNAALTDQVDVGEAMDFAALSRFSSGDLKILSFIQTGKAEKSKLLARDGISSVEELKGKKIGVQKATVNEYVVAKYLDKFNIKPNEISKEGLSSNAELIAAFERGDIKAAFFSGTFLDKALKVQGARVIGSQADIPFAPRGFLVAKDKLLKEKPEAAKRILLALNEASKWINENPEAAGEIAFKTLKLPKDGVARDLKDITNEIRLTNEDVEQLRDVYDYAVKNNLIKGGFNLKEKIVIEPLKQALPEKLGYNPDNLK